VRNAESERDERFVLISDAEGATSMGHACHAAAHFIIIPPLFQRLLCVQWQSKKRKVGGWLEVGVVVTRGLLVGWVKRE
jgi:hypothetical protein